jgi:PAS domain S-box-containing protein
MKLRTQYLIMMLSFGAMLAILAASVILTNERVQRLEGQEDIARNIQIGANELGDLASDYLLHGEGQQRARWEDRFAAFAAQAASLNPSEAGAQVLATNLKASARRLQAIFADVAGALGTVAEGQGIADRPFLQTAWSRLQIQNQSIIFDASRLAGLMDGQATEARQLNLALMMVLIAIVMVFLLANYLVTFRRTLGTIAQLHVGTEIVGAGDLSHRLASAARNELGELADAFDAMTTRLQTVTVSRDNLLREIEARERAETALSESEQQLRVIFEAAPVGISVLDAGRKLINCNDALQRITRITREGLLAGAYRNRKYIRPDGTPLAPDELASARAITEGRPVYGVENGIVTESGEIIWTHVSAAPLGSPEGGLVVITQDITERMQAEAALRQSEERFARAFRSAPVSMSITRVADGRYLDVNELFLETFGYSREEVIGHTSIELGMYPDLAERADRLVRPVQDQGRTRNNEAPFPTRSGERRDMLFSMEQIEVGGEACLLATLNDITDRKHAESQREAALEAQRQLNAELQAMNEDLRDARAAALNLMDDAVAAHQQVERINAELARTSEWLRVTLTSIGDAVIAADADCRVTFMNPVAAALTGWDQAQALGQPIHSVFQIIDEQTRQPADDIVTRALSDKGVVTLANHTALVTRAGRDLPIEDSAAPILDAAGNVAGVVLVFHDVTDKRRAQQVLQTTLQRFYSILSNMYAGILLVTDENRVEFANPAFCDYFDLKDSPESLVGLSAPDMIEKIENAYARPGKEVARIQDIVNRAQPVKGEEVALTGGRLCLRDFSPLIVDGQLTGRLWVHVDITERKRAEEALRESEERYRLLFNGMTEGFALHEIICDAAGVPIDYRFLDINPAFEQLTGLNRADVVGKNVYEVLPDTEPYWVENYGRVALAGPPIHFENYSAALQRHYEVFAFSPAPRQFAVLFLDITQRKQAEAALRESEAKYRRLIENITDLVCEVDAQGKYLFVSGQYDAILGYAPDELVGHSARELIHPDDVRLSTPAFSQLVGDPSTARDQASARNEWRFRHANGHWRWFDCAAQAYQLASGETRVVVISRDITARKQMEEALRETRDYLQNLIGHANAPIIVWNPAFRITQFNRAFERLTGRSAADMLHRELDILFPPDRREESMTHIRRTATGERWEVVEIPIQHTDGSVRVVMWNSATLFASDGQTPLATIAQGQDITALKEAEETSQRNEALLRAVLDNLPIGVWTVDTDGQIVQGNPAAQRIWGGAQPMDIVQIKDRAAWRVNTGQRLSADDWASARAIKHGQTCLNEEIEIQALDGTHKIVLNSAIPLRNARAEITGAVITNQDITDRKRADVEIKELNVRLEARAVQLEVANKELESFSYSVSHDLRAPLRGIDGFSQALLEDYGDRFDDTGRDYLQRVRRGAQHMAELIEALLGLSRMTRAELRREPVDLSAAARTIADELRARTAGRTVEFVIAPTPAATGDPQLLRTLLTNLLDNAWKFTANCSQTRIEFGALKSAEAAASSSPATAGPIYFVRDNGAGFDMAYADKLFGAFQRLHGQAEYPGTGIGLATVQRIVRRHGGRIWAEAAVDQGATFYFTL